MNWIEARNYASAVFTVNHLVAQLGRDASAFNRLTPEGRENWHVEIDPSTPRRANTHMLYKSHDMQQQAYATWYIEASTNSSTVFITDHPDNARWKMTVDAKWSEPDQDVRWYIDGEQEGLTIHQTSRRILEAFLFG